MAAPKTKKSISEFKAGLLPILKAHHVDLAEVEMEKLTSNLLIYFANKFKPDEKTPHWETSVVPTYFQFYFELVGERPAFLSSDPKSLKLISKTLMERYMRKNPQGIWDEETCTNQHLTFYNSVITLPYVRENFSISFLFNFFDKICSQLAYKNKSEK